MINGENLHIALTWASKGTQKRGRSMETGLSGGWEILGRCHHLCPG